MEPGEQAAGTRDEHYNLISVLYHALHGAENCEIYAADAETTGRGELAAFFREAQVMHAALAEQAKGHLGIRGTTPVDITQGGPASGAAVGSEVLASGGAPGDIPPGSAEARRGERPVDDVPDEPPNAASPEGVPPTPGVSPGTTPLPDEDLVAETGDVAPDAPAEGEDLATPAEAPRNEVPPDAPREAPPQGEERPERRGEAPATDATPREEPPLGEERPERRTP